jgi:hypothetical protein
MAKIPPVGCTSHYSIQGKWSTVCLEDKLQLIVILGRLSVFSTVTYYMWIFFSSEHKTIQLIMVY